MTLIFNKAPLLLSFTLFIFISICKLNGADKTDDSAKWKKILQLIKQSPYSHTTMKKVDKLLESLSSDIPYSLLNKIKTNKSKLNLLMTFNENNQKSSVKTLLRIIEPKRLNNDDSLQLILKLIQMKSFDISTESNLKLLIDLQTNALTKKNIDKSKLILLQKYLKSNLLISDAIKISKQIWKDDRILFEYGELHNLAFKYTQQSKKINHKEQAIKCFNKILRAYPKSSYRAKSAINAIALQITETPPEAIRILLQQAIYPFIKEIPLPYKNKLLSTLTVKLNNPETIVTLKEWYLQEKNNKTKNQFTNEILIFLVQKAKFDISKLTQLINKEGPKEIKEPDYFRNMSIEHKIQFLIHWRSRWEPYSEFSQKLTGIFKDDKNQLILKCKNTNHSYTKLTLNDNEILNDLDFVFFKIKNPSNGHLINISVRINQDLKDISNIRPNDKWQLIRIPLNKIKQKILKITIYLKSPKHSGNNFFYLTPPTHLKIKSIKNLQQEVK